MIPSWRELGYAYTHTLAGWLYLLLLAALLACLGFVPYLAWRQYRKARP